MRLLRASLWALLLGLLLRGDFGHAGVEPGSPAGQSTDKLIELKGTLPLAQFVCGFLYLRGVSLSHTTTHFSILVPPLVPPVPAPENVKVQCSDHRPWVSWDHPDPHVEFIVRLDGSGKHFEAKTRDHKFNLSDFVWFNDEQMFEYLIVYVTAMNGSNRSERGQSPSFSYYPSKTVDLKCTLKLPEANLTLGDSGATLTVKNPLHFYKELKNLQNTSHFELYIKNGLQKKEELCQQEICKVVVDLPEDSCVNVTGFIQKQSEYIKVLRQEPVCAAIGGASAELWLVAVLGVVLLLLVIVGVIVASCKTRAWIFPKIPTPKTLVVPNQQSHTVSMPPPENYSIVQITAPEKGLCTEDPEYDEVHAEDQILMQHEDQREDHPEYQDDSETSTQTETVSMHSSGSEGIIVANYERRPQLIDVEMEMDMDGDMVNAYRS
ncbi:hypothetical protein WMY93_007021 [Mugilogobius chulae]|uniref:Fibronectin type-III domain-containing protein n=1 Tax=Mugilogobius chulae TaxID=88201 RepID=A0AAW0PXU8_9GOBI